MKELIVVATTNGGLDDTVSPVFGRTPTFTLVEVEDGRIVGSQVVPNPFQAAAGGAGIQAAQFVAERRPRAVIAGNIGPNASGVLAQMGIDMVSAPGMRVRDAVEKYLRGELPSGPTGGYGPGMGYGPGRGMGRGYGRGWGAPPPPPPEGPSGGSPEELKRKISELERELEEVRRKLDELKGGR